MKKNLSLLSLLFLLTHSLLFSQTTVYNPAEFEKSEGVLLVWDYSPSRDSITANIAKAVQNTAKVWIIYYPEDAPADTGQIREYLYSRGVQPVNLYFIPGYSNTLWIRDFGPMVLYGNFGQGSERFVIDAGYAAYNRPKDDSIPAQIANLWNWNQEELDLEIEGGNLIFDGLARGFASKRVFEQNPELTPNQIRDKLIQRFNLQGFTFLETLDNSGGGIWKHVDMFMKIIDYETIMVSSYPDFVADYAVIEENVATLRALTNHFGKPYEIIRIPAPPKADGTYASSQDDEMRTYTNSLTINNSVIVPSYGLPEYDQQAFELYQQAMPGYKIFMVDAQMLTPLGGAIHCITREIPSEDFMRFIHRKVVGTQSYDPDFYLYSLIESNVPVDSMWLHYKINDGYFQRIPIYTACPQNIAIIEGLLPGDVVQYYMEAVSGEKSTCYPLSAPAGYFSFWFDAVNITENTTNYTKVNIVPQPGNGDFSLYEFDDFPIRKLSVYNMQGQEVWQKSNSHDKFFTTGLKAGTYFITVETGNNMYRSPLIIGF
ncbi:MAG: agmatine deiminase family protein [Bacteroidales bacterium]|nr:agmatine deiminase family protein [Bacteroidales bacterium]